MWGMVFKIKAPFGHFRNPFTTTLKQTYPFPPKPTVIGMIGAILGWDEETVIRETGNFKIAITFWKNKGKIVDFTFVLCVGKIRGKSRAQEAFRPERFEILLYPEFEILILHESRDVIEDIADRIKKKDFFFPLFMGKNEFLITEVEVVRDIFELEICKVDTPAGIVFRDGYEIPDFSFLTDRPAPVELFIGVPRSFELVYGRRKQREDCVALVVREPIRLKEPLDGVRIDGSEYTVI